MMSYLFNSVRKELFSPLAQPRMRFSSGTSGSSSTGTSSSTAGKTKPQLTKNEERIILALKATAVFLPGVYLGHVMTKQNIIGEETGGDQDNNDKDGKDKKKDEKDDDKKDA
ncbi:hypothetical protein JTE90_008733 [Oedothorax gibbosus]|uniref:Uncharacterized protein n=1 Tax=Oedothorax gibbosus TaxID=931172 RepID=A0AAV6URE3_9ARAC|nr:hypothetical protein JTE90_008733 [Oedothorax gibbosus]